MKKQFAKVGLSLGVLLTAGAVFTSHSPVTGVNQVEAASKQSVSSSYSTTTYSTTDALNLRQVASTKGKVLLTIPKGKAVTMVSNGSAWSKVTYSNKTGYVSSKYVKKTVKTVKETKIASQKLKSKTKVALYNSVTSSKKSLLTIPSNTALTATAKLGSYYKVTYKGQQGWVSGSYLKPYNEPIPALKNNFLSKLSSEKILLNASSTNGTQEKLFSKYSNGIYYATLLKSTDKALSARYNVTFVYQDSKKTNSLMVNTQRYRDNKHLQKEGDKSFVVASEAFFGSGTKGSKELLDFVKKNLNAKSITEKKMTFGGNVAEVRVDEFSITINFY